ncbi:MFS transporter [Amycolatopsis sp. NPDC059657]|uniref:MFS transporter n=1 Tax=Amycolatopsis sp. NPDC059657 TaxID=3346899 RepID=UPI00366D6C44
MLLLIPGGPSGMAAYEDVVPLLAEHYTVLTYDPRGLSESTLDDPDRDIAVETQADDAHRVLRAVTGEPASVFANSGGSNTGLVLATTHPGQVRAVVVHEPPIPELFPDAPVHRARYAGIYRTARTDGVSAALGKFLPLAGFNVPEDPDELALAGVAATLKNLESFLGRPNLEIFFGPMWRPLARYAPDLAALRALGERAAAGSAVMVNTVNYVRDSLGRSQADVALLLAGNGVGTIVVALVVPRVLDRVRERDVMLAGACVLIAGMFGAIGLSTVDTGGWRWTVAVVVWAVIGSGTGLVLTPVGRVLRRSSKAADRPAIFAAQFSLSHACWLLAYPIAGWLGTGIGFTPAWIVLGVLALAGIAFAVRYWPRHDPEVVIDHRGQPLSPGRGAAKAIPAARRPAG